MFTNKLIKVWNLFVDMENCIICNENLSDQETITVKEKGLKTLAKASLDRDDGKIERFKNIAEIVLHKKCRQNYTRKSSIEADKKKMKISIQKESLKLRSGVEEFDFKQQCLFCVKKCDKKLGHRKKFSCITTIEIKTKILRYCEQRNDEWARDVRSRIETECDLVACEARYHRDCYASFSVLTTGNKNAGRPTAETNLIGLDKILEYLNESKDVVCQFSLNNLYEKFKEFATDVSQVWNKRHFREKLGEHYKDEIVIVDKYGESSVVCFKGSTENIIKDTWRETTLTLEEKRDHIIQLSAKILKEDIRSESYNLNQYPSASDVLNGGLDYIPRKLLSFLSLLFGKSENDKKVISVANVIISGVRPRSFISPVLFSLAIYLHRKFGSKILLDLLHSLGFSESYKEALKFENTGVLRK